MKGPWWKSPPQSCQSQPGPSMGSVLKTNLGQKDIPNILKVDSDDLKEPQKWSEVGLGWRGRGLTGKKWALSREHFQDLCQGHSQDVYPLTVGVWGSSLDSSALVRQIGKGNSLGENVLTIHNVPFGLWVYLLRWGNLPFLTFRRKFMAETEHYGTWGKSGLQSELSTTPSF